MHHTVWPHATPTVGCLPVSTPDPAWPRTGGPAPRRSRPERRPANRKRPRSEASGAPIWTARPTMRAQVCARRRPGRRPGTMFDGARTHSRSLPDELAQRASEPRRYPSANPVHVDGSGEGRCRLSCLRTSVTVLCQDIGDTSRVFGGDSSGSLGRCRPPMSLLILVSVSRSPSGLMTLPAER